MNNKLFVGNLNFQTTEQTLGEIFGADGRNVTEVLVMKDRYTNRPRGFAFVTMATDEEAQSAIAALNGAEVDGRPIRVNVAQPREERPAGGRGFGGGGGRGFGGDRGGYGGDRGGGGGRGGYGGRGGDRGGYNRY